MRSTIYHLVFGFLILVIVILCNVIYQNIHCQTPVAAVDPFQIAPCEAHMDQRMIDWKKLADKYPDVLPEK